MRAYLTDLIEWRGRYQKGILRFTQVGRARWQAVHILQRCFPDAYCVLMKKEGTQSLVRTREIEDIVRLEFGEDLGRLSVIVDHSKL